MRVASSSLPHHSLKHVTLSPNREMNEWQWQTVVSCELWMMRIRIICRLHHVTIVPYHIVFITLYNFTVNFCWVWGCCHFLHRIASCLLVELKICREIEFMIRHFGWCGGCVSMWFTLQRRSFAYLSCEPLWADQNRQEPESI